MEIIIIKTGKIPFNGKHSIITRREGLTIHVS